MQTVVLFKNISISGLGCETLSLSKLNRLFLYITVLTAFIGTQIASIDFGLYQLTLFRISLILLLVLHVINLAVSSKLIIVKKSVHLTVMFVWFIYAVFTVIWSKDFSSWFRYTYFIFTGFILVYLFIYYINDIKHIYTILKLLTFISLLHLIIGLIEVFTANYFFLGIEFHNVYTKYSLPVSVFQNTNNYATFLFFSFFIFVYNTFKSKGLISKILFLITSFIVVFLIVKTTSRANLLALIIGVSTLILLRLITINKSYTGRKIIIVLVLVIFAFVVVFYFNIYELIVFDFSGESFSDTTRFNLMRNGLVFLVKTLGFGVGSGNINYWMQNFYVYYTNGITSMHNWWFEILVSFGVVIFTLYVISYIKIMTCLLTKSTVDLLLSQVLFSYLMGYIISSLSSSSNTINEWLWAIWAILIAYVNIKCKESSIR